MYGKNLLLLWNLIVRYRDYSINCVKIKAVTFLEEESQLLVSFELELDT